MQFAPTDLPPSQEDARRPSAQKPVSGERAILKKAWLETPALLVTPDDELYKAVSIHSKKGVGWLLKAARVDEAAPLRTFEIDKVNEIGENGVKVARPSRKITNASSRGDVITNA